MKTAAIFRCALIEPTRADPGCINAAEPTGEVVARHIVDLLRASGVECRGPVGDEGYWFIYLHAGGQACEIMLSWAASDRDEDFWALQVFRRTTLWERLFHSRRGSGKADSAIAHVVSNLEEMLLREQKNGLLTDLAWMSEEEFTAHYVTGA